MNKTLLPLLIFLAWMIPHRSPAQPVPPAASEIFITTAAEVEVQVQVGAPKQKRWIPGKTKLAYPWSDQPFAVHIPFDLKTVMTPNPRPMPGVPNQSLQAAEYIANLQFRGFADMERKRRSQPSVLSCGVYRPDEQPVFRDSGGVYTFYEPPIITNVDAEPGGRQWPFRIYGGLPMGPGKVYLFVILDPRYVEGRRDAYYRRTFTDGIDAWEKFGERATGTLVGSIVERTPQSTNQAVTINHPITVKQNGWVVRSASASAYGDWSGDLLPGTDEFWRLEDGVTEMQNKTVITRYSILGGRRGQPRTQTTYAATWQFPSVIWDHMPTNALFGIGSVTGGMHPLNSPYALWDEYGIVARAYQFSTNAKTQPMLVPLFKQNWISNDGYQWGFGLPRRSLGGEEGKPGMVGTNWSWATFKPARPGFAMSGTESLSSIVSSWTGDQRMDEPHRLLTVDIQFWSTRNPRPAKRVDIFAVRLSDLEDNRGEERRVEAATVTQTPDDGFFEWRAEFRQKTKEMESIVNEAKVQLKSLASDKSKLRQEWKLLMRYDQMGFRPLPQGRDIFDDFFEWGKSGIYGGRNFSILPTLSKESLASLKKERLAIQDKMMAVRAEQARVMAEAERSIQWLVTSALIQAPKSRESLKSLLWEVVDYYKDLLVVERVSLMEHAAWYDNEDLPKAIADLKFNELASPDLQSYMTALYWYAQARSYDERWENQMIMPVPLQPGSDIEMKSRAAWLEALIAFRKAVTLDPKNADARLKRAMIEIRFVQMIAGKLDREKQLSFETFQRFIAARGNSLDRPQTWWEGAGEGLSIILSLPSIIAYGVPNTVGVIEEKMGEEVETAAKHHFSLLAIARLLRQGMSLEEIRNVTPATTLKYFVLRTISGDELPADKADRICRDIRETFAEMPDLLALVGDDRAKIEGLLDRSYYISFNPQTTWTEFFANTFLNPINLAGAFAGSAIVKVGGKWQTVVRGATLEARLLEVGGKSTTLGEVFSTTLRLDKAGALLSKSGPGKVLKDLFVKDAELYAALSIPGKIANTGSRIAATVLIYAGIADIADQNNLPALKLLVEALGALNAESYAYNIISGSGAVPAKLASKVDEFAQFVARQRRETDAAWDLIVRLEKVQARMAQASKTVDRTLTSEERTIVASAALVDGGREVSKVIPGKNPETDLALAVRIARERLEMGDAEGALKALNAAKDSSEECKRLLQEASVSVTNAREALKKPRQDNKLGPYVPHNNFRPVGDEIAVPMKPEGGYAEGKYGAAMAAGDEAMKRGDFDRAAAEYAVGKNLADKEGLRGLQKVFDEQILKAREAQKAGIHLRDLRRRVRNVKVSGNSIVRSPTNPITQEQLADLMRQIEAGGGKFDFKGGSLNPVFEFQDNEGYKYIFKYVTDTEEIGRECLSPDLANFVGSKLKNPDQLKSPSSGHVNCRRVLEYVDADGKRQKITVTGVLSRYVAHREFYRVTEPELLAMRKEFAVMRVFRLWLGDTDGHLRNQLIGEDGGNYGIDFGFAEFGSTPRLRQNRDKKGNMAIYDDQHQMLRNAVEFPFLVRVSHKSNLYGWIDRMDDFVTYDDMKEAVEAIEKICANERGKLGDLIEARYGAARRQEILDVLIERGELLHDVLRKKFDPSHPNYRPRPILEKEAHLRSDPEGVVIHFVKFTPDKSLLLAA